MSHFGQNGYVTPNEVVPIERCVYWLQVLAEYARHLEVKMNYYTIDMGEELPLPIKQAFNQLIVYTTEIISTDFGNYTSEFLINTIGVYLALSTYILCFFDLILYGP